MDSEKIDFLKNINFFFDENDIFKLTDIFAHENPEKDLNEIIMTRFSSKYKNYYLGKEKTPLKIMNLISKEIKTTKNGVLMAFYCYIYHKFSKTFLRDTIQKNQIFGCLTKKIKEIATKDFLQENIEIMTNITKHIQENENKINELKLEIENLSNCKIMHKQKDEILETFENNIDKIKKLQDRLILKDNEISCIYKENEDLKQTIIEYLKLLEEESIEEINISEIEEKLKFFETRIRELKDENYKLKKEINSNDQQHCSRFGEENLFLLKKIIYKETKYKKNLEKIKEYVKVEGVRKNKKFFSIEITESVLKKINKKTGYTKDDFDFFLQINQNTKNIPRNIKKTLLNMINIITKGTGSKLAVWFRNFHTDNKNKIDVYDKFYYTYINPFDDEKEITIEEYRNLSTKNKRKLLIENYKKFDEETKNMISLYDGDNKTTRGKNYKIDNETNYFEIVKNKINERKKRITKKIEKIRIHVENIRTFSDDDFMEANLPEKEQHFKDEK